METLPVAAVLSRTVNERHMRSALPDAPVVPDGRGHRGRARSARAAKPIAARPRRALARALEGTARALDPGSP
ncbi:MAG: hypothetical protein QG608_2164 [Actinomycetota bacterium]|nr:hypothetical protein [Actinomycetota bacterium]